MKPSSWVCSDFFCRWQYCAKSVLLQISAQLFVHTQLNPISILTQYAKCVACGSIKTADIGLEYISHISSPDGNVVQRTVTYFSEALETRESKKFLVLTRSWNGIGPNDRSWQEKLKLLGKPSFNQAVCDSKLKNMSMSDTNYSAFQCARSTPYLPSVLIIMPYSF